MLSGRMKGMVILSLGIILTACGSSPVKETSQTSGQGVLVNPFPKNLVAPHESTKFYYAVGEGKTQEAAKNAALSDIASRISVSIESTLNTDVSVTTRNGAENKSTDYHKQIVAKAKVIEFTGVKPLETAQMASGWQVLVSVDKKRLFQRYLEKLKTQNAQLEQMMTEFNRASPFEQLKRRAAISNVLSEAAAKISVLQTLNAAYKAAGDQKRYDHIQRNLMQVNSRMVVHISADQNSTALASLVKNALTDQNIKVSNRSGNVNLFLKTQASPLKIETTNPRLAQMKIVKRKTSFIVKDAKGTIISNAIIRTKGISYDSYKDAIQKTASYQKLINQRGIVSVITGNK